MNKLTAANNPFYVDELLSPIKKPMADSPSVNHINHTVESSFGWLGRLTNRSYEAWLARGGVNSSVE